MGVTRASSGRLDRLNWNMIVSLLLWLLTLRLSHLFGYRWIPLSSRIWLDWNQLFKYFLFLRFLGFFGLDEYDNDSSDSENHVQPTLDLFAIKLSYPNTSPCHNLYNNHFIRVVVIVCHVVIHFFFVFISLYMM